MTLETKGAGGEPSLPERSKGSFMQTVVSQLNSVPGVIGSLACDREGRLLAHAFPSVFDGSLLADAARVIVDGTAGLELAAGQADLLEFRFADAHVFVKPFTGGVLLALAGEETQLQVLSLSVSLAAGKLAKLLPAQVPARAAPEPPPPVAAAPAPPAITMVPAAGSSPGNSSPRAVDAGKTDDDVGRGGRVARPTKGLEELRRRLAGGRDESGNPSVTLPLHLPSGKKPELKRPPVKPKKG
jgi:predicted regulator of Ras-like GTPase activity (Roadblock/LC7/MglB family)